MGKKGNRTDKEDNVYSKEKKQNKTKKKTRLFQFLAKITKNILQKKVKHLHTTPPTALDDP